MLLAIHPARNAQIIAVAKQASGYQKPLVHDVKVDDAGDFKPVAVAVNPVTEQLYWSDHATGQIHTSRPDGTQLRVFASGLKRVMDIWIHPETGQDLYFTEAASGTVFRCFLDDGGATCAAPAPVLRGLAQPKGLTVDYENDLLFVVEAATGTVLRLPLTSNALPPGRREEGYEGRVKERSEAMVLLQVHSDTILSQVAVLNHPPGQDNPNFDLSSRMFWTEINTNRVRRATIHGTVASTLRAPPRAGEPGFLLWPVAARVDQAKARGEEVVYVGEFLGRIWEFDVVDPSKKRLVLDAGAYSSASQVRSFFTSNFEAGGAVEGKYRTFFRPLT